MCDKKNFSFKVISVILILILPLFCFSASAKTAYADSDSAGGLILSKVVKDNIKVGGVDSVLTGYYGTQIGIENYYSYYEITPKDKNTYFSTKGSSTYWNSNGYKLNVLAHDTCDQMRGKYANKIKQAINELKDIDISKISLSQMSKEDFNNAVVEVLGLTGITCELGAAFGLELALMTFVADAWLGAFAIASVITVTCLVVAGLFCAFCAWEFFNDTDSYWSCEIDKIGFDDGEGIINIGDCDGGDDGIVVLAMNNNKIVGYESVEWFKGNDYFDLHGNCNKIIIAGGYGCWTSSDTENTSIKNMVDDYTNINKEYVKFINSKYDNLINDGYISSDDFAELKNIYTIWNDDIEPINTLYENIKRYIVYKYNIIINSSKDLVYKKVDGEVLEFYNDAFNHVNNNDYQWVIDQINYRVK